MAEESKVMTMKEAISKFVKDGMTLYISAVWANHAAAAAHEIIRQGKKDLTLIESSPGEIFDQMIGAGCAKRLIISWSANEAFGTGYRFRRAVEKGLIEVEDYSNFGLTTKLMAGAMGLPFMPILSQKGSSINEIKAFLGENKLKHIECPFTGQKVTLISGINPDVSIIHCQRADLEGNIQTWGSIFSAKWGTLAGKTIIASVEDIVDTDTIRRNPELTLAPGFRVAAVVHEPWGAHPGHLFGYHDDDRWFRYMYANFVADDDGKFKKFLDEWVYGVEDRAGYITNYIKKYGYKRLMRLKPKPFYSDPINYGTYPFDTMHMDI
jgi:glutaconate CoA-transferase, subunit A